MISVDTKKKALIGSYGNHRQKWRKTKSPNTVNGHDFPYPSVPRAYPYGLYDLSRNGGFVTVDTDRDTSAFSVARIRGWWHFDGRRLYPKAERLLIATDGGVEATMDTVCDCGSLNCKNRKMPPSCPLRFATFRREQANGTRGASTRVRNYETTAPGVTIASAILRPASDGVQPVIAGNKVTFTLPRPG